MDNLTPEQIKQMISMLQQMLPKENSSDIDMSEPITKSNPKSQFANKFDQMQESRLHKEDIAVDKALSVYAPTPRTRPFYPFNVQCRVCGKQESINPIVLHDAPDRYKCNVCSRSPG